ncbi:MAG: hypothetical protein LLG01_19900 [Planctomycetaceae bacterium]|nr:hypothetical protein [Planctomycetaceae bacterium]
MTIRDELQAALRRGCATLDRDRIDAIRQFLALFEVADGGFRGPGGASSDLYYTMFGCQCIAALDESPQDAAVAGQYLDHCWRSQSLDLIHLACLARCWAAIAAEIPPGLAEQILIRVEAHRSDDGGYAQTPGSPAGSAYDAFLALGAYQDLGRALPDPQRLAQAVEALASPGGGYTNSLLIPIANVPATAAAMIVLRHVGRPVEARHAEWLARQCHAGFVAWEGAPQPDLLSTAVALHALKSSGASLEGVRDACGEFVHTACRHESGAFRSSDGDDAMVDVEYLYYGLLACGSLAQ